MQKAEEKVGGKADFGFDKRAVVFRMKIEKLERGKSVVWSCHGDQPEWNGTTLTWDLEMFAICNSSWGELMYRLKNYVEGRKSRPALDRIGWRTSDMPDIQHSVQIAAKPEAIYLLVATADGFRKWWATDVIEAGGVVELGFFNRASVYRLRLQTEKSPTEVEWRCETGAEWTGTRIRFRLEAGETGTLLRFTHADWQAASDYFISCNTAWGELMYRLKAVAQGKTPGPLFSTAGMAY